MDILLTWVGARDPAWLNPRTQQRELGPILSLLRARAFDAAYLLLNLGSRTDNFRIRATAVLRECERRFPSMLVRQKPVDLVSVVDYREIFRVTNHVCQEILSENERANPTYFVYLSPGTPQMQTVWILLVQSGLLPARMIESTPPDLLGPDAPAWREVDLTLVDFPQVVNPGETQRLVSVLQAQNDNLAAENRRLRAEAELARASAEVGENGGLPEGYRLRDHLVAQERAMYLLALMQANGNASAAARLIGLDPAAFRARAATLSVRQRRAAPADS